jgi:hypothetical protein
MMQSGVLSQMSDASQDFVEGRLLDGFLLLAAGGSTVPEDVVCANMSSLQIVDVAAEDLQFFEHLDRLDVSDNQLSYEQVLDNFAQLPRLTTLLLSCNSISALAVQRSLERLQQLDLSFNELHGDVLAQLALLPKLKVLNLSSNCISSVPPEEDVKGLRELEELCLDANDLVQFVQWRALVVLPRLRKLSLASNRVKRLKDDAPDPRETLYFPALTDLNLSSNEIAHVDDLPVLQYFRALRDLHLVDNPCSQHADATPGPGKHYALIGTSIQLGHSKPWYLHGSGCFAQRPKLKEPRLKLDRRRMRRVPSVPVSQRQTRLAQLGTFDDGGNQLSFAMPPAMPPVWASRFVSQSRAVPCLRDAPSLDALSPTLLTDEDLTEEQLEQIFKERRSKISRQFSTPTEDPRSFMRPPPFKITAAAGKRLGFTVAEDSCQEDWPVRNSSAFITMPDEDTNTYSGIPFSPQVSLPPIAPDSRSSSRSGVSRTCSVEQLPREKPRSQIDVGVREAMRALRAAAMSEFAVAA